jgi:hypothetical protein
MTEQPSQQQHQSATNNGRVRTIQPPAVAQDYYGTMTNRLSPGIPYDNQSSVKKKKNIFASDNFIIAERRILFL